MICFEHVGRPREPVEQAADEENCPTAVVRGGHDDLAERAAVRTKGQTRGAYRRGRVDERAVPAGVSGKFESLSRLALPTADQRRGARLAAHVEEEALAGDFDHRTSDHSRKSGRKRTVAGRGARRQRQAGSTLAHTLSPRREAAGRVCWDVIVLSEPALVPARTGIASSSRHGFISTSRATAPTAPAEQVERTVKRRSRRLQGRQGRDSACRGVSRAAYPRRRAKR